MSQTILAISGKPGLYKLVSRAKNSLIVESLDASHKRMPAFATDRITSLADIALYKVFNAVKELEQGKPVSIDYRKASGKELQDYFTKVLPQWDRDRVHTSDIKKLLQWYNILVSAGITDFNELTPTEGDNIDNRENDDEQTAE